MFFCPVDVIRLRSEQINRWFRDNVGSVVQQAISVLPAKNIRQPLGRVGVFSNQVRVVLLC